MKLEIKVPAVGESITEAIIGSWTKKSGEFVKMNEVILNLETDKASVEVVAEKDGVLSTTAQAGDTVKIGAVIGSIDTDGKSTTAAPASAVMKNPTVPPLQSTGAARATHPELAAHLSPATQRAVSDTGINPASLTGTGLGGRLTKSDVLNATPATMQAPQPAGAEKNNSAKSEKPMIPFVTPAVSAPSKQGDIKRVPMTNIRKKIAERLVQAQQTAAILTTFNEVDMTKILELRTKYKDKFKEKYGVNLGFNGFFVKAVLEALKSFPAVNASITGDDVEYHNYYNIGMAVSTDRGLMVPVIKDADLLSIAGVELALRDLALKGRDGKITPDNLMGGTFSITNGGVFGSLLSTPILNPPQSAILGLHKIEERAVVINGKVEARSMMYVALSYDHRLIDGKEAVSFLVKVKEGVEDPERLLIEI